MVLLQVVGITEAERQAMIATHTQDVLDELRRTDPWLLMDPSRA
ncbi:hypothetical protein GCM10025875_20130 [Litorihabitans aurantiacus]|uniref:Suppressor of fused-like domain-containing protein n=1 Tax=Litorihabitans aurantiacus TaxID=1930061 RepID=A0AA38CRN0_9MICO|nr:hypothetical protein GCM10025875_20130 [Litorihabitans aurantiacus]